MSTYSKNRKLRLRFPRSMSQCWKHHRPSDDNERCHIQNCNTIIISIIIIFKIRYFLPLMACFKVAWLCYDDEHGFRRIRSINWQKYFNKTIITRIHFVSKYLVIWFEGESWSCLGRKSNKVHHSRPIPQAICSYMGLKWAGAIENNARR